MYRVIRVVLILCFFTLQGGEVVELQAAGPLVVINAQDYSRADFDHWWKEWQEPEMSFPERPDGFIDFHLLAQQAREMEYFTQAGYLRKLNVFLKVRAMAFLKNEEVDSRINITDKDVLRYFRQYYSPVWSMQILTYDDEAKAREAWERLKPFDGQPAGRLVFGDLGGVTPADNGPSAYEEPKADPSSVDRSVFKDWLQVIRELPVNSITDPIPLDDGKRFAIIRMKEISEPGEDAVKSKATSIFRKLRKGLESSLTGELVKKLKKKYKVRVDEELLAEITLDVDYQNDFLEKVVISMEGLDVKVKDVIYNVKKDMRYRQGVELSDIKKFMVNSIISQTVITKEALDRHYEDDPPFKWTYEFYQQNRLRIALESDIRSKIEISDQEIETYYKKEKTKFGRAEMATLDMIVADKELIEKMWSGILLGSRFAEQAKKYSKETVRQADVAVKDLSPQVRKAIERHEDGEISAPFEFNDQTALVKLWVRTPGSSPPLDKVRAKIVDELKALKFKGVKEDYLKELRRRSTIKVAEKTWKKLKKEFETKSNEKN